MKVITKIILDFTLNLLYITLFDGNHMVCGGEDGNMYDLEFMNKLDELEGLEGAIKFGAKYRDMFEPISQIPQLTGIPTVVDNDLGDVEDYLGLENISHHNPTPLTKEQMQEDIKKYFHLTIEALEKEGKSPTDYSFLIAKNMRNHSKENGYSDFDLRECKRLYDEWIVEYQAKMEHGLAYETFDNFHSSFVDSLKYYTDIAVLVVTIGENEYYYKINSYVWETIQGASSVGGYYTKEIKGKFPVVDAFGVIDFSKALRALGKYYVITYNSAALPMTQYNLLIIDELGDIRQDIVGKDKKSLLNRVLTVF